MGYAWHKLKIVILHKWGVELEICTELCKSVWGSTFSWYGKVVKHFFEILTSYCALLISFISKIKIKLENMLSNFHCNTCIYLFKITFAHKL